MSGFLAAVGNQPWDIVALKRTYEHKAPPRRLRPDGAFPLDVVSRGFQFIGRKTSKKPGGSALQSGRPQATHGGAGC
jgi:hypothetical protein